MGLHSLRPDEYYTSEESIMLREAEHLDIAIRLLKDLRRDDNKTIKELNQLAKVINILARKHRSGDVQDVFYYEHAYEVSAANLETKFENLSRFLLTLADEFETIFRDHYDSELFRHAGEISAQMASFLNQLAQRCNRDKKGLESLQTEHERKGTLRLGSEEKDVVNMLDRWHDELMAAMSKMREMLRWDKRLERRIEDLEKELEKKRDAVQFSKNQRVQKDLRQRRLDAARRRAR